MLDGMGHIVFAAPPIADFHLHERLRRDLQRRGHRVSVLCAERHEFTFWREQFADVHALPSTRARGDVPRDLLDRAANALQRRDAAARLHTADRWLEDHAPDLLLFHQRRSATAAVLQFAARSAGVRVLWTGRGLLPHTMQVDERGLDGDAGSLRLRANDYRVVRPDAALLDAGLTHALAASAPHALPRAELVVPPLRRRCADAARGLLRGDFGGLHAALNGWTAALGPRDAAIPDVPRIDLQPPFVAVLLQSAHDPRVRLDAAQAPPAHELLGRALDAAMATFGERAGVVAVLPPGAPLRSAGLHRLPPLQRARVQLVTDHHNAAVVVAAAAATVTVNHPAAFVALLAGTPVVLLGRALFELHGVTTRGGLATLTDDVRRAAARDRPALRRRLLTWHLRHGHVWCSAERPNHNGVLGLGEAIERRLAAAGSGADDAMHYRPGPTWPLATT